MSSKPVGHLNSLDGQMTAADSAFANLRVWRDLNQNGLSEAGELSTLAALDITSINVAASSHIITVSNGNLITDQGSYTRGDGTVGTAGEIANSADVQLATDPFHTTFTTPLSLTAQALTLPDMNGSGQVRSLREAISSNSTLATLVTQFTQATTSADRRALLDNILKEWSNTSTMGTTFTGAYAGHTLTVDIQGTTSGTAEYQAWADKLTILEHFNGRTFNTVPTGTAPVTVTLLSGAQPLLQQSYDAIKDSVYGALVVQAQLKPYLDQTQLNIDATGVKLDLTAVTSSLQSKINADNVGGISDLMEMIRYTGSMLGGVGIAPLVKQLEQNMAILPHTPALDALYQSLYNINSGLFKTGSAGNDNTSLTTAGGMLLGFDGNDTLRGDAGNDNVLGGADADILYGGYGNDLLIGGTGNDTLSGGDSTVGWGYGNDTYQFSVGDGSDTIFDYDGTVNNSDTVRFVDVKSTELTGLNRVGAELVLNYGTADKLVIASYFATTFHRIEQFQFSDGVIWGDSAIQAKLAGATMVAGTSANNTLAGTTAAEIFAGLAGDDIYTVNNAGDLVLENLNEGTDTVKSSITYTLTDNVEKLTLTGTTVINGTGNVLNNVLTGNGANNILTGGAGNDTLNGGAGADTLIGGINNDTYVVDNMGDVVTENTDEGTDLVQSSITYTLGINVENLTFTGGTAIDGTGNALNNVLTGSAANNLLTGGAGNDTLKGNAGNDTLSGGTGTDTLTGGTGNDTYQFTRGDGADTLVENDSTAGNSDLLQFMSGVSNDQLWFKHTGNNLVVSVIGTTDKITLNNWYLGSQYQVETIMTADGNHALLAANVDNLVQAMASFAPPAAGQITLPASYQTALNPVIAANWQ